MRRSPSLRFLYRLALRLGEPNVHAMARRLTAKQLLEWEAYALLEPFDERRADYRAASIVQMLYNMNVKAKDRKALKEFLLKFGDDEPPRRKQTWQEQQRILTLLAAAYSTPVKDGN